MMCFYVTSIHVNQFLRPTFFFFFKYICLSESCALHVVFGNVVFNVKKKGMNCSTFAGYTVMKNANATENLVTLNFYEEKLFSFFLSTQSS